ncbi:hypothetical protein Tco_1164675 [Tanacetum coccineum]
MRTRSQARRRRQPQVRQTSVESSNLEKPDNPPIVAMADNRTMAQLLEAPTEGYEDAIVIPEITANNFEIKHGLLNLVQNKQFFGNDKEDPHAHIRYFNKITSTMKIPNVPNTSVKLMLFPFSLEGAARIWLEKEPPRSIETWDDLNTMAEQNVPAQPPTRTDEQIVPRSQWLTIGKSNLLFNAQKIKTEPQQSGYQWTSCELELREPEEIVSKATGRINVINLWRGNSIHAHQSFDMGTFYSNGSQTFSHNKASPKQSKNPKKKGESLKCFGMAKSDPDNRKPFNNLVLSQIRPFSHKGRHLLEDVTIQDPVSEATPKLHEVVGKGKAVFILARRDQSPPDSTTGPSSRPDDDTSEKVIHESSSTSDSERTESDTETAAPKGDKDQDEVDTSTVTSGVSIPVSDPEKAHEALAGPDPEPMNEDQTGSDSRKLHIPSAFDNYLGTKLDDALLKVLERHTADLIEKYSALPGPESTDKVDLKEFDLKSALFTYDTDEDSHDKEDADKALQLDQTRVGQQRKENLILSTFGSAKLLPNPKADDQSSKKPMECQRHLLRKQHPLHPRGRQDH